MNRTPRNACSTSGVSLRGKILSDSVSAADVIEIHRECFKSQKMSTHSKKKKMIFAIDCKHFWKEKYNKC